MRFSATLCTDRWRKRTSPYNAQGNDHSEELKSTIHSSTSLVGPV